MELSERTIASLAGITQTPPWYMANLVQGLTTTRQLVDATVDLVGAGLPQDPPDCLSYRGVCYRLFIALHKCAQL